MNQPKPTPEQFTHNGVLMQPHFDNAVRAWEKLNNMGLSEIEKAAEVTIETYKELYQATDAEISAFKEGLDAGLSLAKQQEGEGWISVKDRLPEKEETILIYCPSYGETRIIAWLAPTKKSFMDLHFNFYPLKVVTHWRPLPTPPNT